MHENSTQNRDLVKNKMTELHLGFCLSRCLSIAVQSFYFLLGLYSGCYFHAYIHWCLTPARERHSSLLHRVRAVCLGLVQLRIGCERILGFLCLGHKGLQLSIFLLYV